MMTPAEYINNTMAFEGPECPCEVTNRNFYVNQYEQTQCLQEALKRIFDHAYLEGCRQEQGSGHICTGMS